MKTKGFPASCVIGAMVLMLFSSCGRAPTKSPIVEFVCDQEFILMHMDGSLISGSGEDGSLALYLRSPKLFSVVMTDIEEGYAYLYLPEDGNRIELRLDGDILYANGIPRAVAVNSDDSSNFEQWLESADETALQSVRFISCGDATNQCRKVMEVNPRVSGWDCYEDLLDTMAATNHTPLIGIAGAATTNDSSITDTTIQMDYSEAVILMTEVIDAKTIEILKEKDMPKLRHVLIYDSEGMDEVLGLFSHVNVVTVTEDVDQAPNLANLGNLEELHLYTDHSQSLDLRQLPQPENLRALTINAATNVSGLEKLVNLEFLNPWETTFSDTELTTLLNLFPNLVFLDLSQAKVESLEPLRNSRKLEAVALGYFITDEEPDFSPLGDLPKLRYVAVNDELNDSDAAAEIRMVCPQVGIYFHGEFCMGSGWLLLFLPFLLIMPFLKRIRAGMNRGRNR